MQSTAAVLDRPVATTLTMSELERIITDIVHRVIREERTRDYYVNEDGVKVLYKEDEVSPEYLEKLRHDCEDFRSGKMQVIDGETVLAELRQLGVKV